MRLLICGDRNWTDGEKIEGLLNFYSQLVGKIDCVIEGECRGADTLGRLAAEKLGIPVEKYPADWKKHGKAAGPIRNQQMLTLGEPDEVWAFHDDIVASKGTRDMAERAIKAGITVKLFAHGKLCQTYQSQTQDTRQGELDI